jgi:hypothetical protein
MEKVKKKQKIENNKRTGCGRLIAMHVGCMPVCICMTGFICTVGACGIVDLGVNLLFGRRAGASLRGLILVRRWTSLASKCVLPVPK